MWISTRWKPLQPLCITTTRSTGPQQAPRSTIRLRPPAEDYYQSSLGCQTYILVNVREGGLAACKMLISGRLIVLQHHSLGPILNIFLLQVPPGKIGLYSPSTTLLQPSGGRGGEGGVGGWGGGGDKTAYFTLLKGGGALLQHLNC
jgi:hypothetical protein